MNWCGMPPPTQKQPRPGWCGAFLPDTPRPEITADLPTDTSLLPSPMQAMRFSLLCEQAVQRFHGSIATADPAQMRAFLAALFILISGFGSHAAASAQAVSGNGLLNGLYNHIAGDTIPFFANSFAIADMIFGGVGTMAVMVTLANYLGEYRTFSGCGHTILRLVLQIAIPWSFLKIAETLLSQWNTVATNVGSYIIGAQDMNMTPDGIFKTGGGLAGEMLNHVAQTALAQVTFLNFGAGGAPYLLIAIIAIICGLILFVTFTLLAVEMLVAFAQGYISLSAGAFNLGWSASKATSPFAMAYWGLVLSTITRIIVTMAVIGIGLTEARDWITKIHNLEVMNPDLLGSNIVALLQIPMLGIALLVVATKVTDYASAQLSGRPVMTGTGIPAAASSAATKAGSIAGKAVGAAASGASAVANMMRSGNSSQENGSAGNSQKSGPPRW